MKTPKTAPGLVLSCLLRPGALAAACASGLLASCATTCDPAQPSAPVPLRLVSTADFRLSRPDVRLEGETFYLRGQICRRYNSEEWSPRRLSVTGYDAHHHPLFRQKIGVAPLPSRTDEPCHIYGARVPASPLPSEIEVRVIAYGEIAP
jgi:hypothetical protein